MQIETFLCPICGKEAECHDYEKWWIWEHSCAEDVKIICGEIFNSREAAHEDWGRYCTMLQNRMDFECSYGFREGYDVGLKDAIKHST